MSACDSLIGSQIKGIKFCILNQRLFCCYQAIVCLSLRCVVWFRQTMIGDNPFTGASSRAFPGLCPE